MGQKNSKKLADFSEDESEWQTPTAEVSNISVEEDIEKIEEKMAAQRDVIALMENQLAVLNREDKVLRNSVSSIELESEFEYQELMKRKRKRRRYLTYYRSSEVLLC